MTDKEFVQSIFPKANSIHCTWESPTSYVIWCANYEKWNMCIAGYCNSELAAWESAAINVREKLLNKFTK
jgi:hypothetical protein